MGFDFVVMFTASLLDDIHYYLYCFYVIYCICIPLCTVCFCGKVLWDVTFVQILTSNYMYFMQFWAPVVVLLSNVVTLFLHKIWRSMESGEQERTEHRLWVHETPGCI
jgi:hypothetical protein